jgi:hypothetical protein
VAEVLAAQETEDFTDSDVGVAGQDQDDGEASQEENEEYRETDAGAPPDGEDE